MSALSSQITIKVNADYAVAAECRGGLP